MNDQFVSGIKGHGRLQQLMSVGSGTSPKSGGGGVFGSDNLGDVVARARQRLRWSPLVLCLLLCSFGTCPNAKAGTYYVATTGSDSNSGTQDSPFLTIQKAADTATNPGDTVLVAPGYYPERVYTTADGTADNRITFRGTGEWAQHRGFTITNSYVTLDHMSTTGGVGRVAISLGTTVRHARVLNNRIYNTPIGTYGLMFNKSGLGMDEAACSCLVSNNLFTYLGQYQLGLGGTNNLIIHNTFDNSRSRDAIQVFGAWNRIVGNTFTNLNNDPEISDHPDCFQTIGQLGHAAKHILIERNLFINNKTQLLQSNSAFNPEVYDWTFRNNLIINQSLTMNVNIPMFKAYNNTFISCCKGIRSAPITWSYYVPAEQGGLRGAATNGVCINNLFFDCSGTTSTGWAVQVPSSRYSASNQLDSASWPLDLVRSHNFASGSDTNPQAAKRSSFTNANLDSINGGDPGFVSDVNLDFQLLASSILLGKGLPLPGVTTDYQETIRPTSPSIGAFDLNSDSGSDSDFPGPSRLRQVTGTAP